MTSKSVREALQVAGQSISIKQVVRLNNVPFPKWSYPLSLRKFVGALPPGRILRKEIPLDLLQRKFDEFFNNREKPLFKFRLHGDAFPRQETAMTKSTTTKSAPTADASRRELVTKLLGVAAGGAALQALTACAGESGETGFDAEDLGEVGQAIMGTATVIYVDSIGTVAVIDGANQNLRGTPGTASQIAVAQGFSSKGDGGGGVFYWDTTTTNRDDGGTYIVPNAVAGETSAPDPFPLDDPTPGQTGAGWRRLYSGPINVKWFGAKGGGNDTDNDSIGIQNAINAADAATVPFDPGAGAPAQWTYPAILFPPGNYVLQAGLGTSVSHLRAVGLGNANFVRGTGFPSTDPPTPAWKLAHPFQLSFEGLSFSGSPTNPFPVGLDLGQTGYNVATASVQLVRCNFFYCAVGLKYESRSSRLNLDYCKFKANSKHIEIVTCDLIYLNQCHFNAFTPAADRDAANHVRLGRLHVYGSSFTPGTVDKNETAWIGIYDDPNAPSAPAHIGLVAHGVRAGGENGGLTFVNYDAAPDLTSPLGPVTRIIIRDSQVDPGQGYPNPPAVTRPPCVVRLLRVPNHVEITGCAWAVGLPVDYLGTAEPHEDDRESPLVYRVEGNCYLPNQIDPHTVPPAPPPNNLLIRTRHHMPKPFVGKANLLSGIRRGVATITDPSIDVRVDLDLFAPGSGKPVPIRPQDISVTPVSGLGAASSWWLQGIADDHFDIVLNAAPGRDANDQPIAVEFAWAVDLGRY
jgi:hypothetical protein